MALSHVITGLKRGFAGRCPNCGEGRVLRRYLKVEPNCKVCGHDNAQYPSDDAPPYFTILIVGHLVVAPMLLLPFIWEWPAYQVLLIVIPLLTGSTLWLLPRTKGAVIGLQWGLREGDGKVPGQAKDDTAFGADGR